MFAKFSTTIAYPVFATFLLMILLAGCSACANQQMAAPSTQTQQIVQPAQQQPNQNTQQTVQPAQQRPLQASLANMEKVIDRAATILGVSESDLSNAFNQAISGVGDGQPGGAQSLQGGQTSPQARPYVPGIPWSSSQGAQSPQGGQTTPQSQKDHDVPFSQGQWSALYSPQGQKPAQGQPASGSSDRMKSVYSKIAATLNLSADNVTAAFKQAQNELKQ